MDTIQLNNGISMPQQGLGVFQVTDQSVCKQSVLTALQTGYRLIDTAACYGNERAVGEAVRESGIAREEVFLISKVWIQDAGYDKTMRSFHKTLENLGTDYLDLYLIHMPYGDYHGSWRAMEELYRAGQVRAIGVCNFLPDRLLDLCYSAEIVPQVNQIERHPHFQRGEELALMGELGVQPQGWAPFAEGLKGMFAEPVLAAIARRHGKTPAQVILRWDLQQGVAVVPKSVHRERMVENLAVWDFALEEGEMAQIAALDRGRPTLLDPREPSEVKRVYDYLRNPVLTSL